MSNEGAKTVGFWLQLCKKSSDTIRDYNIYNKEYNIEIKGSGLIIKIILFRLNLSCSDSNDFVLMVIAHISQTKTFSLFPSKRILLASLAHPTIITDWYTIKE